MRRGHSGTSEYLECSLRQLGDIIDATRKQFASEGERYKETLARVEEIFAQSGHIERSLADLTGVVVQHREGVERIIRSIALLRHLDGSADEVAAPSAGGRAAARR